MNKEDAERKKQEIINDTISFFNITSQLFSDIGFEIKPYCKSFQLMSDDNFSKRKDRIYNDIHLFLELHNSKGYFHLKAYCEQTISQKDLFERGLIYLTGYRKFNLELHNGTHSLTQQWYRRDAKKIVSIILRDNKDLFLN